VASAAVERSIRPVEPPAAVELRGRPAEAATVESPAQSAIEARVLRDLHPAAEVVGPAKAVPPRVGILDHLGTAFVAVAPPAEAMGDRRRSGERRQPRDEYRQPPGSGQSDPVTRHATATIHDDGSSSR